MHVKILKPIELGSRQLEAGYEINTESMPVFAGFDWKQLVKDGFAKEVHLAKTAPKIPFEKAE